MIVIHAGLHTKMLSRRAAFGLGCAAFLAGCAQFPDPTTSPKWRDFVSSRNILVSGQDLERIQRIGRRVLSPPSGGPQWQFGIDPSQSVISLAVPDNGLVLSKGLLDLCENDGQVAAILVLRAETMRSSSLYLAATGCTVLVEPDTIDVTVLRRLAHAGYDPRDALVITERLAIGLQGLEAEEQAARVSAMKAHLRTMGYQI
jgi:hypothetical protein